ncbi:MAG TPA: pyridoxamine 5'-phosphate oxidase family protein [Flavisolibacter sp.]
MDANQQLNFLQERIEEIGSAIFYNLSEAVLKLPTSIVSTVKVDDYGFVWFFVQKPSQRLSEFEQEFPVKLDFYKKGKGYFLQVMGKGFVVNDPEEMNSFVDLPEEQKKLASGSLALVKVKIQEAKYYETRSAHNMTWWQSAWSTVSAWFRQNTYRPDNTYFPAS